MIDFCGNFSLLVLALPCELAQEKSWQSWKSPWLVIECLRRLFMFPLRILQVWPSTVAHAYNPSTLGGQGGWITRGQKFETSLANAVNPVSTRNTKISQAWWQAPVIPATQEAEAGESLEPGRQRSQ